MSVNGKKIILHDMCLRDGMHAKRHQITIQQMIDVATGLDEAGVPLIQITHGDGLGAAPRPTGIPCPNAWGSRSLPMPRPDRRHG